MYLQSLPSSLTPLQSPHALFPATLAAFPPPSAADLACAVKPKYSVLTLLRAYVTRSLQALHILKLWAEALGENCWLLTKTQATEDKELALVLPIIAGYMRF